MKNLQGNVFSTSLLIGQHQSTRQNTNKIESEVNTLSLDETVRNAEGVEDKQNICQKVIDAFYAIWLKLEPILFPVVPKSPSGFVSFLFWHSILLTASTPLARIFRGQWMGIFTVESILSVFGLETRSGVYPYPDTYLIYPQNRTLDVGFSFHAFFGLLWLLMVFVQMVPLATKFQRGHKIFGYLIQFSFVGHLAAAVSLLLIDTQHHHWLPKFMLMSPVLSSITYMFLGIQSIRRGDVSKHIDQMFRCFIYSIEGAGTIRTVEFFLWLAGQGPTFCQSTHGATATHCVTPYVLRLLCTRFLSLYWIGCYARMRGNSVFTKSFLLELVSTIVCSIAAYSYASLVTG